MNIAVGSIIVIFYFVIPGIIFYRFYYTAEFSKQFLKPVSFFQSFVSSLIPSFIFLTLFYFAVIKLTTYRVDFELIFSFIFQKKYFPNDLDIEKF